MIQATAVGSTGVEAETLAKTALLLGPERGLRVLEPAEARSCWTTAAC